MPTQDISDHLAAFVEKWAANAARSAFANDLKILANTIAAHKDREFSSSALSTQLANAEATLRAINIAVQYGASDKPASLHWVVDQMVRALAGEDYERIVAEAKAGDEGPETYSWDEGVEP